jgi:hypothetical protein
MIPRTSREAVDHDERAGFDTHKLVAAACVISELRDDSAALSSDGLVRTTARYVGLPS